MHVRDRTELGTGALDSTWAAARLVELLHCAAPTSGATQCALLRVCVDALQLYVENILALEAKAKAAGRGTGRPIPLAIMTSDDTHDRTRRLLQRQRHFGASPEQIHLIKQEKVG